MGQAIVVINVTQSLPPKPCPPVARVRLCTVSTSGAAGGMLRPEPESRGANAGSSAVPADTTRRSLENSRPETIGAGAFLTAIHDTAAGTSRHSLHAAQTVRVDIPWPVAQAELPLSVDVSNGSAGVLLISESQGASQMLAFEEGVQHVLRRGREIAEPVDALYLLLTSGAGDADVDVHTDG